MPRGYWRYIIAAVGCLILSAILGWALQPEKPNLTGDRSYREHAAAYRATDPGCEPSQLDRLPVRKRQSAAKACSEAQTQHEQAADSLVAAGRGADAADASAIAAYEQARVAAWGISLGILTLAAAGAAALFAERAAHHTKIGSEASRRNLSAFTAVEDASLIVSFANPTLVTGTKWRLTFNFSISNMGRSTALVSGIDIDGTEQIMVLRAIKPDETFKYPNRISVGWRSDRANFDGAVEYSTALRTAARRRFTAEARSYPESANPILLVDSMWTEEKIGQRDDA